MRQAARVFIVLAVAALFVGVGLGVGEFRLRDTDKGVVAKNRKLAHFYKLVAGQERALSPTADATLARDLQDRLGPIEPGTVNVPERIVRFRGSSLTYGGVSNLLGQDPFVDDSCECGALTPRLQRDLLRIKRGEIRPLVANLERPVRHANTTFGYLIFGGVVVMGWGLLLWQKSLYRKRRRL